MNFNEGQIKAIHTTEGPLLVLAGPGTGKTRVLIQKIVALVQKGISPQRILAVTFSKRATGEMEERLLSERPDLAEKVTINTIHSLCIDLVQRHAFRLGLGQKPQLMSEAQAQLLFRQLVPKLPTEYFLKTSNVEPALESLFEFFATAKDEGLWPEDIMLFAHQLPEDQLELREEWLALGDVYNAFQSLCFQRGLIDFGDAILLALRLLEDHKVVRDEVQNEWDAILIDEFQDTNLAQIKLIRLMSHAKAHVCAVGDDDQSIYRFRGASFSAFTFFEQMFPELSVVSLSETYRLSPEILQVASALIEANGSHRYRPDKKIISRAAHQGPVEIIQAPSFEDEAYEIIDRVQSLLEKGVSPQEIGILVRAHNHGSFITQEAARRKIPLQSLQSESLFDQEIVRDILAFFQLLKDPTDSVALLRILNSPFVGLEASEVYSFIRWNSNRKNLTVEGLGQAKEWASGASLAEKILDLQKTFQTLTGQAAREPASEILFRWLEASQIVPKLLKENILDLKKIAKFHSQLFEWESTQARRDLHSLLPLLESLFRHEIQFESEGLEHDPDSVALMTLHASKGLEFDYVFIPSLVGRRMPVNFSKPTWILPEGLRKEAPIDSEIHLQEERRLLYVGLTRARKGLTLTTVNRKGTNPSLFLKADIASRIQDPKILRWIETMPRPIDSKLSTKSRRPFGDTNANKPSRTPQESLSLSYTELEKYERCPQAYWFQYELGIPPRPSPMKSLGIAIHSALEKFYVQIKMGTKVTEDDLLRAFEDHFQSLRLQDPTLGPEHHDVGVRQLRTFFEGSKDQLSAPLAIEVPFSFVVGKHKVRGKIDRVDGSESSARIIDYKTGRSRDSSDEKDQKFAESSLQFSIYALAAKECFGWNVKELTFYYLADGSTLTTTRTSEDLIETKKTIQNLADQILKSQFEAKPSFITCRGCDYLRICPSAKSAV